MFELQLSDRGCVSRLLSLLGVTLNSVLVAEVNRRRRGGIMTERASIYLIQNQQACTEGGRVDGVCRSGLRKQLLFGL